MPILILIINGSRVYILVTFIIVANLIYNILVLIKDFVGFLFSISPYYTNKDIFHFKVFIKYLLKSMK